MIQFQHQDFSHKQSLEYKIKKLTTYGVHERFSDLSYTVKYN